MRMGTDLSIRNNSVQPAGVQCADDHLRVDRTIDDVHVFVLQLWSDEPGGNQDDASLTGHPGKVADYILQSTEGDLTFLLASTQYATGDGGCERRVIAERQGLSTRQDSCRRAISYFLDRNPGSFD